ncbi:VOC family virulence protein [Halorubrum sp. Ib24]|uniref:VOC family protein n=1 Tax=Halorubrum sp. Ib24 TaxID=1383850 RepID=UPI000B99C2C1|nr:VOC family protein [Halorubrum sp. Ib24]OYR40057.1 VOC family virulence protein [Halorubrum sp. Ib24]
MHVTGLDHAVLTVADVDRAVDFYAGTLGGTAETFDGGRRAVSFGDQKINFHPADAVYSPHADRPTPGSGDLCLVVDDSLEALRRELGDRGVEVVHGPVKKVGARGPMESMYVRDPDGNLVELARYDANA